MSGQFDRRDFEQNPANLKKKRSRKDWDTNEASELCSEGVLSEPEIKQIKEENWLEKHVPKPSKREIKYSERINELENASIQAPLSKKESKELKKLNKKYKKLYKYRHRDLSSSHCCLKTCLAVVTLCVVLSCAVFFGGYHFFVQPYTGITLFEAFDVMNGIFDDSKINKDEIIKQKFDADKDGDAFFTSLQQALFLDENTKFTVKDLLTLIPKSEGGTGEESASIADLLDLADEPDNNTSGSLTGNAEFDKLLENAKFDFSSLKNYNGGTPVWEITDKSVAGVLQQVINEADSIPQLQELLGDKKIDISEVVAIGQCLITKSSNDPKDPATFEIVIQVKIHSLVEQVISSIDLGSMDGLVRASLPLIKKHVPDSLYLIARTTPEVDSSPTLGINSIDAEVLQRLISTIDKKVANGQIEKVLNSVGNTIFSTVKKINELATEGDSAGISITPSTAEGENGTIEINLLTALMKKMDITNVTSSDFLTMVKHLHLVNLNHEGNTDAYLNSNYDIGDGKEFQKSDIEEFNKSKLALFKSFGISESFANNVTPENFIDSFTSIQDEIRLKNSDLYSGDHDSIKADSKLSAAALAQIMNGLIKKQAGDKFDITIDVISMKDDLMKLVAKVNIEETIKSIVGDKFGPLESLVLSVFPSSMYVEITVPYTKGAEGFDVIFNFVKGDETNLEQSEAMFDTISKLLSKFASDNASLKDLSMEKVKNKLKDIIYPALDNLNIENSDIEIKLAANGLQFPTVFEIVAATVNKNLAEGDKLQPQEIQDSLRGYYKYNGEEIGDTIANNLVDTDLVGEGNFVSRELTNKFFMKAYIDETNSAKPLNSINESDVFSAIKGISTSISADNISKIIDLEAMGKNKNKAQAGNLEIGALELAKLISMSGELNQIENISFYENFTFTDMKLEIGDNSAVLSLVIAAKLNESASTIGGFDINNFATKHLIIGAEVDLKTIIGEGENQAYKTKVTINDAADEQIDKLLKIITQMTGSSSSDFNQTTVAENIGKAIFSAFKNFEDQGIKLTPGKILANQPNGDIPGFKSTNIYELIGKMTMDDQYETGDDEHLKNIICKLNNPQKLATEANPVIQGNDDSYIIPDGVDNAGMTLKLIKTTTVGGNNVLNIHDAYIGRQLRQLVSSSYTTGFELTRFAILNDPAKREDDPIKLGDIGYEIDTDRSDFDRLINGLNIRDIVNTQKHIIDGKEYQGDIFSDLGNGYSKDNGLMFMHFRVGKNQLIQDDSPIKALLPENIYSGAFLNLNAIAAGGSGIVCSYLNDLSKAEMTMLTKLSTANITKPVTDAIDNVITQQITLTFEGQSLSVGIGQILNLKLLSANNTEYVTHTYSYYEGSIADLTA